MELTDAIADFLYRAVLSLPKDWPCVVSVQADIEADLRQIAMTVPTNSVEFLSALLSSHDLFRKQLFTSTLPENLRIPIHDLLERRTETRSQKEELVATGNFEQAAKCRVTQQELTDEINNQMAGKTFLVTISNVRDAISQVGWPAIES